MPIYEFQCEQCGKESEILVRSRKRNDAVCPKCGSKKLTRKFSTFASAVGGKAAEPACSGKPSSCGLCGTGKPHSH